jgi:hypothetical protein
MLRISQVNRIVIDRRKTRPANQALPGRMAAEEKKPLKIEKCKLKIFILQYTFSGRRHVGLEF